MKKPFLERSLFEKHETGTSVFAGAMECFADESFNELGTHLRKTPLNLVDLSERDLVQHISHLARRTFSVDANFYPLGSCTMKYNPKINEKIAGLPGFTGLHPLQDEESLQGALEVLFQLENRLCHMCGMDAFSLQPAAGAQGELAALLIAGRYFKDQGERKRTKVVIPDSSHGTNAASATLAGMHVVTIPSRDGEVDLEALGAECDETLAVFMLTNPNTLGLFERQIEAITRTVKDAGGLSYCDGANLNALLGLTRPGDMGFDMMHVNTHKTLSTPHGGGGPGAGPVGVKAFLKEYLPGPRVDKCEGRFSMRHIPECSIGDVKTFWGNFGVLLRAAVYCDALGSQGLKEVALMAILNANYLKVRLKETFDVPYDRFCMHEFVMTPNKKESPARTLDIAKRLLDFEIHAPTIYFPLIVKEAIMVEPTETESLATLDNFVATMNLIAHEAGMNPDKLKAAPHQTFRRRLDEVQAARNPVLRWPEESL